MKLFDVSNEKYHMGHFIYDGLRSLPNAICQIDAATGESETNASVLRRTLQLVRCLRRFGVRPGDVLALSGTSNLDLHIPFYAALMVGMPIAAVDSQFKYTEIKGHFMVSSPKIAFCKKGSLEDYLKVIKDLNLDTKLICFDDGEYSVKKFIQEYDDNNDDSEFEPLDFDLDQIYAWLVSTGGTTGVIKLAAIKHRTFFKRLEEMKRMMQLTSNDASPEQITDNKPALHLSPLQWISSYFVTLSYPVMRFTKIMTSAPTTTEHVIDIINKYKPVSAMIGPSLATSIIKSGKECDFTCFDVLTLLGAKIHNDIYIQIQKKMRPGVNLVDAYGQTENLGPILTPNPTGPVGNCGKCTFEFQKNIKLVDPETGIEITKPNVTGELWTKVTSFSGYYNNPLETANAHTEDGWYKTGDLLYRDEEGNYFFVERLKMLIKYRSYHVVPPEVEAVILEHPGVEEVVVTSIPHEEDGEHPVACVVRKNGSNVTAQEIKDIVASKLSDSQQLRGGVVFIDDIPLTSVGKINRNKLKQMVVTAQRE